MSTILVVDDEPAVRDALQRALSLEGYEVVTAGDGEAALAAHDERMEVVLPVHGYRGARPRSKAS